MAIKAGSHTRPKTTRAFSSVEAALSRSARVTLGLIFLTRVFGGRGQDILLPSLKFYLTEGGYERFLSFFLMEGAM